MDKSEQILNDIYQNTKMGYDTINTLLPKVEDEAFKRDLITQRDGYDQLAQEVSGELIEAGHKPEDNSPVAKVSAWSSIQINTLTRHDASHIAEMLIRGSAMGTIDMQRILNHNKNSDSPAVKRAQALLKCEEQNIQRLKQYL